MNVLIGILITLGLLAVLCALVEIGMKYEDSKYAKYLKYPYYALVLIVGVMFILSIIAWGEVEYPIE